MKTLGSAKHFFLGIVILLAAALSASAQDAPPEPSADDPGFYYIIQKGDTLWDLSQRFYNSQWDWPGLWEMNKEIKNPHWIYPGRKIKIYLKSERKQEPVAQTVPVKAAFNYPAMDKTGFIKKEAVKSLGTIIREQEGNVMIAANDVIYIKPATPNAFTPGESYHVFSTEKIKEKFEKTRFSGVKHLIKARIEVLEAHPDYVKAQVTHSYRDAGPGDQVMALIERDTQLIVEDQPDPIDAVIVCSEDNTLMINDNRIAFINMGRNHQIQPGQIYSILQSPQNRQTYMGKTEMDYAPFFSGKLLVLHTEEISATVVILSSKRDIHPGDLVN